MRKIKLLGKGSFGSKVIRAFGRDSGFELPVPSREKKTSGASVYHPHYNYHIELRNAMLETERLKAKGIMEYQRQKNRPC